MLRKRPKRVPVDSEATEHNEALDKEKVATSCHKKSVLTACFWGVGR